MDFSKLSRDDWLVGGGGILLIIDLLALPWFSVSFDGITATSTGTGSPGSIWGVLALIVTLAVVIDLALARFSPATQIPTTQLGRDLTRVAAAGLAFLLLIIKFLDHTSNFGFGFYLAIILGLVVLAGAWLNSQSTTATV
jgi:hypothetical protein